MKLDVGCNGTKKSGYIGIDKYPYPDVDYVFDISEPWPVEFLGAAEEILCEHTLEHLTFHEVDKTLMNFQTALKPHGRLVVIVPNLPELCRLFHESTHEGRWKWWIKTIYGNQAGDESQRAGQEHKSGFDARVLSELLNGAGFIDIEVKEAWDDAHSQPAVVAVAHKRDEVVYNLAAQ